MIIYLFLIALLQPMSLKAYKGAGAQAGQAAAQIFQETARTTLPIVALTSENLGINAAQITSVTIREALPQLIAISEKLGLNSVQIIDNTARTVAPLLATASIDFGSKFGYDTVLLIGNGISKAGSAIASGATQAATVLQSGVTTIIASPATPYIVVGVGVVGTGFIAYKVYYYYNSETGQKIAIAKEKIELCKIQTEAEAAEANLYNARMKTIDAKQALVQKLAATTVAAAA